VIIMKSDVPVRELFGIPIAAMTLPVVLDLVHQTIVARGRLRIGVVNAAKIVNMGRDRRLRDDVLSSDIVLADGASVVLAGWILRRPLPERVAGIDLMLGMLERGGRHQYRVFCLGASEGVLRATTERIARDYPGVNVVGCHHGYFEPHEEAEVAATITAAKADILLVGMSSPKKEAFLARWSAQLRVPVCHGVGGAFDVMAGRVQRAPVLWQRLGLEWLYRLRQEPGRLWRRYLVTNTLFCRMLIVEMFRPTPRERPWPGR
jgi:N-acetylglucosaminyldiphosphoundecaprenol N-acetyl-beta-D-mannosaminyltransferase